jgi:hypothetical protein
MFVMQLRLNDKREGKKVRRKARKVGSGLRVKNIFEPPGSWHSDWPTDGNSGNP